MASAIGNKYPLSPSYRTLFSGALALGLPPLTRYLCRERYDRQWHWPAALLSSGLVTSMLPGSRKVFSLLALSYVGYGVARYAFPPEAPSTGSLCQVTALLKREKQEKDKGSGALLRHPKLGCVIATAEHVVADDTACYIGGIELSLKTLERYESGDDTLLFKLDQEIAEAAVDEELKNILGLLEETDSQPQVGETVYFCGYPFTKEQAHLHTGSISSIGRDGKISIDGTAVPGMSGGPIAVKRKGKLCAIGIIASETFDPVEGFARSLSQMQIDQSGIALEEEYVQGLQIEAVEEIKTNSQFTKITRDQFYIDSLTHLQTDDPNIFQNIWDDLHGSGVIAEDGTVNHEKVAADELGLRDDYKQHEAAIRQRLKATDYSSLQARDIQLASGMGSPTNSLHTVSLSLARSLSTGVVTGHLFQPHQKIQKQEEGESDQLPVGRKKRLNKAKNKVKAAVKKHRAKVREDGSFTRTGAPPVLYRFVTKDSAKNIRKNGIPHLGDSLDEIPFLTKPHKGLARSVGAVAVDRVVAVYPNKIPGLKPANVRRVAERKGAITYRINCAIPKGAVNVLTG